MSRSPDLAALTDRSPQGIAGVFGRAIRSGELAPGDRLPTVREVATELGVSPATVSAAWQAMRRTGVVVSRGRAGTFVRETPRAWLSPRQRGLVGASPDGLRMDLSRGTPDPALLPSLGPAFGRVSARAGTGVYQDEPVLPQLRSVLEATWPYPAEVMEARPVTAPIVVDLGEDHALAVAGPDRVAYADMGQQQFVQT